MEFWAKRAGGALFPDGDESLRMLERLPQEEAVHVIVRRPRSGRQNRLFWTIINRVAEGTGTDPQIISDVLKIATGHYKTVRSKNYGSLRFPRSISFAEMGQDDFNVFFERALQVIFEEWGIDRDQFADLLGEENTTRTETKNRLA